MYSIPTIIFFLSESLLLAQHETILLFQCPKHAFMPCWIAVQYVARVLHFSASSLYSETNAILQNCLLVFFVVKSLCLKSIN